ncbi:hypothetical protein [Clostridioides difficile]|uniref:hypothetical protein n=1 Tax=Clostridioides difficile TaxID=1496 RepID=UPI001F1B9A55|nr:hypothetical protein [Clostridioides difficile]
MSNWNHIDYSKKIRKQKVVNNHVSKNKFANFEQTFTKYSENELDDIIKKSQKRSLE